MRTANAAAFHTNQKYNFLRAQQINAGANGFGLLSEESAPLLPPLEELKKRAPIEAPTEPGQPEADKKTETTAQNKLNNDVDIDDDFYDDY